MTGEEFALKCQEVLKYKTCYASGTFGQNATPAFIKKKAEQYPKWYTDERIAMLLALPDDTKLFDCAGLIKGVYWGFPNIVYTSNGLRDINDQGLWDMAIDKSTDFSNIQEGELLWLQGHVGLYIGHGKGIECTNKWANKVQITAVENIANITGFNSRKWTAHGKLPFLSYYEEIIEKPIEKPATDYSKFPVLRKGSRNDWVKVLQRMLLNKGCNPLGIDGKFGKNTLAAVLKFQRSNTDIYGRQLDDDGVVGPLTWGSLYK